MFAQTLTLRAPLPQFSLPTRSHLPQPYPTPAVIHIRSQPSAADSLRIRPPSSSYSQNNNCVIEPPPPQAKPSTPLLNPNFTESQNDAVRELIHLSAFLILRLIFQKLTGDSSLVDLAFSVKKTGKGKNYENATRLINYVGFAWAAWKIVKKIIKEKDDHLVEIENNIKMLEKCLNDSEDLMEIEKSLGKLQTSVRKVIDLRTGGSTARGGGGGGGDEAEGNGGKLSPTSSK